MKKKKKKKKKLKELLKMTIMYVEITVDVPF
jgi:hypothetical protein